MLQIGPIRTRRIVVTVIGPFFVLGGAASLPPGVVLLLLLVAATAICRAFRTSLEFRSGEIVVRNLLQTKVIPKDQIDFASFAGLSPGMPMTLRFHLKDGSRIRANGVSIHSRPFSTEMSPTRAEGEVIEQVQATMKGFGVRFEP